MFETGAGIFKSLAVFFALLFWLLRAMASAAELETPPPPASSTPGHGLDIANAEQIWPAANSASAQAAAPAASLAPDGLPQGVTPNPNLPADGQADMDSPLPLPVPAAPAGLATNALGAEAPGGAQGISSGPLAPVLAGLKQDGPRRATMESLLFEQLKAAMPTGSSGYIFEKASLPSNIRIPNKPYTVRYDLRLPESGIGAVTFTGNLVDRGGTQLSSFTGSVWLDREAQGIQVNKVVGRGDVIRAEDVQLLGTRLSQLPRGALENKTAAAGMLARTELRPGMWLTEQTVQAEMLVKRGQEVTIRLQRGPLEITAPGACLQSGTLGQVIKVQNTQTKREIMARVSGKDEVQVMY